MGRVSGKVAFITGAGQGQGRSHAVRLAEEGADIIATDICRDVPEIRYGQASMEDLEETQNLVRKEGRRCEIYQADVRSLAEMRAAVAAGLEQLGHIDIVLANAGLITFHRSSLDISEELYDLIVDTDLKGVWNTVQATAPSMIEARRGGSMIFTSSAAGIRGQMPFAHYVAAKFGVVGLMKAFSNELARYRIRVNTVHPTAISSPGMGNTVNVDELAREVLETEPMFMMGATNTLPDLDLDYEVNAAAVPYLKEIEISNAILFLASDEARYITGVTLPVDAGNTTKP
jgi:SDR family mycofactocin-dependent oxidoreductase